jgi:hypothetical protein
MAKNHRGKRSPRKMHTHTRKRPSNAVRYVDDTVYFPPTQWPSFSEESIQRQLGIPVPDIHDQPTYVNSQGNAIPWWEFAYGDTYHRPDNETYVYLERFERADATTRYEMEANLSAHYPENFTPAEQYTYGSGPVYYPSTLEMAGEYEAEVATYYSPRQQHVALHPTVEVGGTTYYSSHQHPEPSPEEEEVSGYIEGYHHPQIEHQTRDWWKLFGDTTGEVYVLDWVKAERAALAEPEAESGMEEWTPERYFAPYRGEEEEICEVEREQEARVVAWLEQTECRGRDDWECQFCGLECFCENLSD